MDELRKYCKRVEEELGNERNLAEALAEAAAAISGTLEPDQVLDRILEQVSRVVPNDAANIMLIEGDQARPVRWRGYERFGAEEFLSAAVFSIPEVPGLQQMVASQEPLVIPDTANYPDWVRIPVTDWLRSYAAAPMIVRGEVIGFLNVDSATPGFFTQAHAGILRVFANQAAVAIENARLYQETARAREYLQSVLDSSIDLIFTVKKDGTFAYFNPRLKDITGYEPDEIRGQPFMNFIPADRKAFMVQKWQEITQGIEGTYETEIINAQGQRMPVFVSHSVVEGFDEYLVILRDITQARQQADDLSLLYEVGQLFSSTLEQEKVFQEISRRCVEALDVDLFLLRLIEDGRLVVKGSFYRYPEEREELERLLEEHPIHVGEGIAGRVAQTGEPAISDGTPVQSLTLPGYVGFLRRRKWLVVPMKVKDKVIGVLTFITSDPARSFSQRDLSLAQGIANQAAIAIENARLYEETRRWAEEMTSVYQIGVATTSTLNLDEVLKSVCEQVSHLMNVSSFYIALYDAEREELHFELAIDEGVPVEKFARKLADGAGLSGWIVQSRQPLLLRDAEKEELPIKAILVGKPARSWLGVPLLYRGQVVGVMGVQSYQPNAFDEDDQQTLSTIAAQVAIAIENARLFAETKKKANDLALLLGTSTAISSTLDLDQILKTVARQIITSLVATLCRITLLDETRENLVIHAVYPIRDQETEDGLGRRFSLAIVPWHRRVIETGQPVVLRQDVPELALSDEEVKMVLTEGMKSAALIPLIVGERVLGVISLGEERSWERSPFTLEKAGWRRKVNLCCVKQH